MTNPIDIDALRQLMEKATAGDLATAERYTEHEHIECPVCQGDGEVLASDYCNIDGKALGVQFYGIGNEFGAHEKLWTAVMRDLPSLLTELEALRASRGRLKLDLQAQECLQDSAYKAGVKHGWNLCVNDDEDGYQRVTSGTEHIAELRRIRADRVALAAAHKEQL